MKTVEKIKKMCETLLGDNLICLLHYGSAKQPEDFSSNSDLDFHLVVKTLDTETLEDIKNIFFTNAKVDISIHQLDEIIFNDKLIFQNGSQGLYFIYVLANSETILGTNIYPDLIRLIDFQEVKKALLGKMRYYLWLLRQNYLSKECLSTYKKYTIRILQDILIYEEKLKPIDLKNLNKRKIISTYLDSFGLDLATQEIKIIDNLNHLVDTKNIENILILFSKLINQILWKKYE